MLIFEVNKQKKLSFEVEISGIEPNLLEYNLRLSNDDNDFGIKGVNENGVISFNILALNEWLNKDIIESLDKISLEINDKNNKFFLKPYTDTIKIKYEPVVSVRLEEEKDETIESNIKLKTKILLDEDIEMSKKKKKKIKLKKSKFNNFLDK